MLVSSLIVSSKPAYRNLMQLAAAILRRGSAACTKQSGARAIVHFLHQRLLQFLRLRLPGMVL